MLPAIAFAVAMCVSLMATPLVVRFAFQWRLFDLPDEGRRIHTRPIPRLGGVAVYLAVAIVFLVMVPQMVTGAPEWPRISGFFIGVGLGGTILFITGLVDDLKGLKPLVKLLAQVIAALVVYAFGVRIEFVTLGDGPMFVGVLSLPLTVFWIVGVTNAFNLIDGLDGLATGIALVALTTTLAAAAMLGHGDVVVVSLALIGALLGFLRYNFNPAQIFLGDSGSLFVGFMLATLSIQGSFKAGTATLAVVPFFALALPLLDTTLAIVRRWLRGVPVFGADARHIHHRLLALGLTHRRAVLVLYGFATILAMLGLAVAFSPPPLVLVTSVTGGLVILALLGYGMRRLDYNEFRTAGAVSATAVLRLREVIRVRIRAGDIARQIENADSLDEVNSILAEQIGSLGLKGARLVPVSDPHGYVVGRNGRPQRIWRLDWPLITAGQASDEFYLLRIWADQDLGGQPSNAERVARALIPSLERWLGGRLVSQSPEPAIATPPETGHRLKDDFAEVGAGT